MDRNLQFAAVDTMGGVVCVRVGAFEGFAAEADTMPSEDGWDY
jgi:hypothetical protein